MKHTYTVESKVRIGQTVYCIDNIDDYEHMPFMITEIKIVSPDNEHGPVYVGVDNDGNKREFPGQDHFLTWMELRGL